MNAKADACILQARLFLDKIIKVPKNNDKLNAMTI